MVGVTGSIPVAPTIPRDDPGLYFLGRDGPPYLSRICGAYAASRYGLCIWVGIGAVGIAILGMWLFNESRDIARIVCLMLIVTGVIGLKVVTPSS
jgi:hypothetical protein